jgi:hypothetical protein
MDLNAKINEKYHRRQEVLLAEYQAAQSSAEHHDRLVWTATSIIWGGSLVLMGFILKNPLKGWWGFVQFLLCFIGILLTDFACFAQLDFRDKKNQKYDRCKEIEKILGMEQHLKTKTGFQTDIYGLIMNLFLLAWGLIAMFVIYNMLS